MTPEPSGKGTFSHVGILVEKLEEAMERFTASLGVRFVGPIERSSSRMIDAAGNDVTKPFRLAYGETGPPHYELIELQHDHYYSRAHGEGFHHLGWWADDIARAVEELRAQGIEPELTLRRANGEPTAVYFAPGALHNLRVELVDGRLREGFLEMLADPNGIR
jgi:catechol 2,3-dioxygenase-like lactoylglutathione lyase family enzyme